MQTKFNALQTYICINGPYWICIMAIVFRKIQAITLFEARQYCNQQGWISNQPIHDSILENNIEKSKDKKTKYNEWKKRIFMKRLETSSSL